MTGVRHNEQPGDLEAGEGEHMTQYLCNAVIFIPIVIRYGSITS